MGRVAGFVSSALEHAIYLSGTLPPPSGLQFFDGIAPPMLQVHDEMESIGKAQSFDEGFESSPEPPLGQCRRIPLHDGNYTSRAKTPAGVMIVVASPRRPRIA